MQLRKHGVQLCNSSCGNLVCFLVPTNLGTFQRFAHCVNLVNTPTPKSCIKQSKMKLQIFRQFLPFLCSVCIRWLGTDCGWSVGVLSVSESGMTIFRPSFHNCIDKAQASWQETQVLKFVSPIYFLHSSFKPLIVVICVGHVIWALFLGLFGFSFCHFPWVSTSVIWVKGRAGGLFLARVLGARRCFKTSAVAGAQYLLYITLFAGKQGSKWSLIRSTQPEDIMELRC